MYWAAITFLLLLWLTGIVFSVTAGGLVHILLFAIVMMTISQLFGGRRYE